MKIANSNSRKVKIGGIEYAETQVRVPEFNTDKEYFDFIEKLFNKNDMQVENYEEYDDEGNPIEFAEDWKPVAIDISKVRAKKFSEVKELPFADVNDFVKMDDGNEGYFSSHSELNYYSYKYQLLNKFHPHAYRFDKFNTSLFVKDLFKHNIVPDNCYLKNTYQGNDEPKITSFIIAFTPKLLLYIDGADQGILYYDIKDEKDENSVFNTILGLLKTYKRSKVAKNKIFIVHRNSHGFEKTGFNISKLKVNLAENYNDDFPEMAEKIITGLNSKLKTNLVILSGEPGTGKCVSANTKITIRNKKTGKIEEINIADLM